MMKKLVIKLLLIPVLLSSAFAQDWMRGIGDPEGFVEITHFLPYGEGKSILAGTFGMPSLNLGKIVLPGADRTNAFFAVIDDAGEFLQAESIFTEGDIIPVGFGADSAGEIWLAISFNSLILNIGDTTLVNQSSSDFALIKYTSDLEIEQVHHIVGAEYKQMQHFTVDRSGEIYVGFAEIDDTGLYLFTNIQKRSPEGTIIWQHEFQSQGVHYNFSIFYLPTFTGLSILSGRINIEDEQSVFLAGYNLGMLLLEDSNYYGGNEGSAFMIKFNKSTGSIESVFSDTSLYFIGAINVSDETLAVVGIKAKHEYTLDEFEEVQYLPTFNMTLRSFDKNFNKQWITDLSSYNYSDILSFQTPTGLTRDKNGAFLVTGVYSGKGPIIEKDTFPTLPSLSLFIFPRAMFLMQFSQHGTARGGQAFGQKMHNMFAGAYYNSQNDLILAGHFQIDTLSLGSNFLINNATEYFFPGSHWQPGTHYRHALGFVSKIAATVTSLPLHSTLSKQLLYPNPTTNTLNLQSESFAGQPVQVQIFSADGRLVRQQNISGAMQTIQIQTGDLPPGMYIATTIVNQQISSAKFVKQ